MALIDGRRTGVQRFHRDWAGIESTGERLGLTPTRAAAPAQVHQSEMSMVMSGQFQNGPASVPATPPRTTRQLVSTPSRQTPDISQTKLSLGLMDDGCSKPITPSHPKRANVTPPHQGEACMNKVMSGGFSEPSPIRPMTGRKVPQNGPQAIAEADRDANMKIELKARGVSRMATPSDSIQATLTHTGPVSITDEEFTHSQKRAGRYSDRSHWDKVHAQRQGTPAYEKVALQDLVMGNIENEHPKAPWGTDDRRSRPEPTQRNPMTGSECVDFEPLRGHVTLLEPAHHNPVTWK